MLIGVLKETDSGEQRVAIAPAHVAPLVALGARVVVQTESGLRAGFADADYESQGARVAPSVDSVLEADVLLQIRAPGAAVDKTRKGQVLIGLADPLGPREPIEALAGRGVDLFALELLPRITRAQSMDVLSSMATVTGYKAVLIAAEKLPKMFPMMVTAAGTLMPAKALIIGAGVAGLQAIATSRKLGAVVTAYDVRPEVKEEIESLGARFAELPLETNDAGDERGYAKALGEDFYEKQRELMARLVEDADVVVTTAAIPGKTAPRLITTAMVERMSPGSVIVDLAAASGGNCELSKPDTEIVHERVTVLGPTNLPATVPFHASQMYGKNITAFLTNLIADGNLNIDLEDELIRETLVVRDGKIVHPRLLQS
jgi:NAD(P) transhydrogenase subunit alpha